MKDIRAVLVVKGKEPEVITIKDNVSDYMKAISDSLTEEEAELSAVHGLDFFSVGIPGIGGVVEEYSACHPYERNRTWHGPALFTQYDDNGSTVSIDDDMIILLKEHFALSNVPKSKSKKINDFIEMYRPKPEIHSVSVGAYSGILNTDDTVDAMLKEEDPDEIKTIERLLELILLDASKQNKDVSEVFSYHLKEIGKMLFEHQLKSQKENL